MSGGASGPPPATILPGLEEDGDRAELRALARAVADRELAPNAARWDETEEFPEACWKALVQAELIGITIGRAYGGMGWATSRPPSSSRRSPGSTCRAPSCASWSSTARPGPSSTSATRPCAATWLPQAAAGRAVLHRHHRARRRLGRHRHAGPAHPRRRRLAPRRLQELRHRRPQGGGLPGVVPLPRQRGRHGQGHRGGGRRPGPRRGERRRHPQEDGPARLHRGRARLRRRADRARATSSCAATPPTTRASRRCSAHINHERCGNAAMCVGAAQGALEYAMAYMRDRKVGGQRLADLQGLQWKIADMATELEGARLLLQRAARAGRRPRHAAAAGVGHGQDRLQPGGQARLRRGHPAARRLRLQPRVRRSSAPIRDIRGLCIGAGTVEIQRNFIGTALLGGRGPPGPGGRRTPPMTRPVRWHRRDPGRRSLGDRASARARRCAWPPPTSARRGARAGAGAPWRCATPTRTPSPWPGRPPTPRWPRPASPPARCRGCGGAPPARRSPRARATPFWPPPWGSSDRRRRAAGRGLAPRRHGGAGRRLGRAGRRPRRARPSWWPPTRSCPGSGTAGEATTGRRGGRLGARARRRTVRRQRVRPRGAPGGPGHAGQLAVRRPLPGRRPGGHRRRLRRPAVSRRGLPPPGHRRWRPRLVPATRARSRSWVDRRPRRQARPRRWPSAWARRWPRRRCSAALGDTGCRGRRCSASSRRRRRRRRAPLGRDRLRRRAGHAPSSSTWRAPVPGARRRPRRLGAGRAGRPTPRRCGPGASSCPWSTPSRWACRPAAAAFVRGNRRDARPRGAPLRGVRDDLHPAVDPPAPAPACGGADARGGLPGPARPGARPSWSTRPCRRPSRRRCPWSCIDLEDGARLMVQGIAGRRRGPGHRRRGGRCRCGATPWSAASPSTATRRSGSPADVGRRTGPTAAPASAGDRGAEGSGR